MFREFWARSAHFGHNGGGDESRGATANFHQIWSRNVVRCLVDESEKPFSKTFTLGVICPQNLPNEVKQAPHSEQATGHGMHCREILFTPRCSPRAREFPRSINVFVRRTVVELRGVKVAKFSDFGLFSPYKTPKTYLPATSLQPRGCIAE